VTKDLGRVQKERVFVTDNLGCRNPILIEKRLISKLFMNTKLTSIHKGVFGFFGRDILFHLFSHFLLGLFIFFEFLFIFRVFLFLIVFIFFIGLTMAIQNFLKKKNEP
jgi:hypothetical protein